MRGTRIGGGRGAASVSEPWQAVGVGPHRFEKRSRSEKSIEEAVIVSRRFALSSSVVLLALGFADPLYAQETAAASVNTVAMWSIITGGFALAFAAAFGALAQAKGLSAAAEGIARNPSAAGEIRGSLLLGLVLIESLVIYVLLISLILFFLKPFGG
jgi:F-type H+-transporting ATPase subunit c